MKPNTYNQLIKLPKNIHKLIFLGAIGLYSLVYFNIVLTPGWMYVGDTPNNIAYFAYQFSSFARGEFPLWDPTIMAGETNFIGQSICTGGPVANLIIFTSVLLGLNDIVLVFAIYVYVQIILYITGVYFLIFSWTQNEAPASHAAIVALFSSSVFWHYFQNGPIVIIYTVPWIIFSLTQYLKNFEFKYLTSLLLFTMSALYAYEFVLPLCYFIVLILSGLVFYNKSTRVKNLIKIPIFHTIFLVSILTLATLPQALTFFDMKSGFLLPNETRLEAKEYKVNDDYSINYKFSKKKLNARENFLACENCWMGAFTGTYFKPHSKAENQMWITLRYYIGPITLPFIFVALFSFSRRAWCIFSSAILISLLAGNVFPVSLIADLPIINLINNFEFLNHYFLLSLIILSALGFNALIQKNSKFKEKVFIGASLFFMTGCLSLPVLFDHFFAEKGSFYFGGNETYVRSLLTIAFLSMATLLGLQYIKKRSAFSWEVSIVLLTVIIGFSGNGLIIKQHRFLQGGIIDDPNLLSFRDKTNHALQFRFTRPPNMELGTSTTDKGKEHNPVLLMSPEKNLLYIYLASKYSSATMKDNSYNHPMGNSGYPMPKSFVQFRSILGNELFLERKFFLFPQVLVSKDTSEMSLFLDQPNLLTRFFNEGVAVANSTDKITSLGSLNMTGISNLSDKPNKPKFKVDILEYNANSMTFKVFTESLGMFVYTDLWHKSWSVEVDGELAPLRKIFHTFKGVELEPGTHEVRFVFNSIIGFLFILVNLTFFALIILLTATIIREKKTAVLPKNKTI